jgi:cyclophilin family peptidyl-prolyl cis-trans isomerase
VLRRLLTRWNRRPICPDRPARLAVELLEHREVPSVTLADITDQQIASNKPFFLPVSVITTPTPPNGAVTTTVSSNNAGVQAEVVSGGRSVQFDISGGTGSSAFSGTLTIRLFEDVAPLASQRVVDLINNGFYVGKVFHRIADLLDNNPAVDPTNVIIQGGSPDGAGHGGSSLPDIVDEFNKDVTFASNGLVAFANAGDDNNNSQFFITDLNRPLAQRIEFLNFEHTIFGILTNGFGTLTNMRDTPVSGTTPLSPLTITAARVLPSDPNNAVIKLTPVNGFTGTASITVHSTDADGAAGSATKVFTATSLTDPVNSRPFLGPIGDQTTTTGTPVSFTIPFTDVDGDQVTFAVRNSDPGQADDFSTAPPNVSVNIDQTTGKATLTPVAGFTGSVKVKLGVRDQTDRSGGQGLDAASNFDTQVINLTVTAAPPPTVPPPPTGPITVQGSPAGSEPRVTVTNSDGSQRFSVLAFAPTFTGGVRTALLPDVNSDGVQDVVAVPADGGAPIVEVISGKDGTVMSTTTVFENTFRGGLFLDVQGTKVVVGAGNTGGPRVTLLDATSGAVLQNFFAGPDSFRGGVSVALGSLVTGQTTEHIVTGLGPGAAPVVSVYDASKAESAGPIGTFFAGPQDDRTGITVKIGDVNPADNVKQIVVTPIGSTSTQTFDPEQFMNLTGTSTTP